MKICHMFIFKLALTAKAATMTPLAPPPSVFTLAVHMGMHANQMENVKVRGLCIHG